MTDPRPFGVKVEVHALGWQRTGPRSRFLIALSRRDFEDQFDLRGLGVGLEIGGVEVRARVAERLPQTVGQPAMPVLALAGVPRDIARGIVRITSYTRDSTPAAVLSILGVTAPPPAPTARELPAVVVWSIDNGCEIIAREPGVTDVLPGDFTAVIHGREVSGRINGWELLRGQWTLGAHALDVFATGRMWLDGAEESPAAPPPGGTRPCYVEPPSEYF